MNKLLLFGCFICLVNGYIQPALISIGDWGGYALGGYHQQNVQFVATAMYKKSRTTNLTAILNTGDNFYYCGIQNITDFQIKRDYIDLFSMMNKPWYNTLGNHDYGYNVTSQVELSNILKNWIMPDRFYWQQIDLGSGIVVNLIVLDTNPCVSAYRSADKSGWDPCGVKYPTCSINHTDDDFEGPCQFHTNIIEQNCTVQYEWFKDVLTTILSEDPERHQWNIVMGHHPIDEIDEVDFTSYIESEFIDLYINGHQHDLEHYTMVSGKGKYITTGAGSMVKPTTTSDDDFNNEKKEKGKHKRKILWKAKETGYTIHYFNSTETITTNFMNVQNEIIYNFITSKAIRKTH